MIVMMNKSSNNMEYLFFFMTDSNSFDLPKYPIIRV